MWRKFARTVRYIIIPQQLDDIGEYTDGCTGIPEIDDPSRFRN
jgi:hypothetical protein